MSTTQSRARAVEAMFSSIARWYDFLNHFLSLGLDITWRAKAAARLGPALRGSKILDLACGTGDLAVAIARAGETASITGGDFSEAMLSIARDKVARLKLDQRITLEKADALNLHYPDGAFDGVTCAFGVRNFTELDRGLAEMARVTKSGGRLVILEFTTPSNRLIGALYRLYFTRVLPLLGGLVSGNRGAYQYLPDTVYAFPAPPELSRRIEGAGYGAVEFTPLTFGICGIHSAVKK